ncbi:hypothetical protein [Sunxiuqinia sp. sy24]|uniref:hypothetical protein n=1 Tax=Sunxiuqinia sp. sy24 TaxID=3461495 RepID=UPI0040458CE8
MKTINALLICLSSLILLSIVSSSEEEHHPNYEPFLIRVDSIQVPDNITINEPFDMRLYGTIGTNGCYQFLQFETKQQGNNITIKAWGKFDNSSSICPTVMVYLDNETLNYQIKEKGTYTIKAKQPDNSFLEKQISVK